MALSSRPSHSQGKFGERRSAPRRRRYVRVLFLSDDSVVDEPFAALLLDSSVGGLRLAIRREEISEGTLLMVRPPQAPAGTPWIPVLVKNCRRSEDNCWELGCQFTYALPPHMRQLFAT